MLGAWIGRIRTAAVVLLVALAILAVWSRVGIPWLHTTSLPGQVVQMSGHAWWTSLATLIPGPWRFFLAVAGDSPQRPTGSTLRVLEDGKALPYPHSSHVDIVQSGRGRYSHWGDDLLFSSSDNSDPTANGRSYAVQYAVRPSGSALAGFLLLISLALLWLYRPELKALATRRLTRAAGGDTAPPPLPKRAPSEAAAVAPPPRRWSRTVVLGTVTVLVLCIFGIGLAVTADMIWRGVYSPRKTGIGIDVSVFHYRDYVTTTQPANLVLGREPHALSGYFGGAHCAESDGTTARFNSLGFRSPEFVQLPPKQPNEIRVIVTGGSVSVSWGIAEACTLDTHLRKILTEQFPGKVVKVFNMGSGGWKSLQELFAIQRYGLDVRPDLIIAFNGFNDITHSFNSSVTTPYGGWRMTDAFQRFHDWVLGGPLTTFQGLRILHDLQQMLKDTDFSIARGARASDRFPEFASAAASGSLATRMTMPIDPRRIAQRTDFDPYNREIVEFYLRNMKLMGLAAHSVGSRVLYALQPVLYMKTPLSAAERKLIETHYEGLVNYTVQGYVRMAQGLQALTNDQPRDRFLDLSAPFTGDAADYFGDYAHMNPAGYRIISARIGETAAQMLRNPGP